MNNGHLSGAKYHLSTILYLFEELKEHSLGYISVTGQDLLAKHCMAP